MYVIPILITYAGAAWAPRAMETHWQRLEAVQTISLRVITGMPT